MSCLLCACAPMPDAGLQVSNAVTFTRLQAGGAITANQVINRLSWGITSSTAETLRTVGLQQYLVTQLHPPTAQLPPAVLAQIRALPISQDSLLQQVSTLELQRRAADALTDDDLKKRARQAYQQALNQRAREAATRSLLRDLYSSSQLQEQMTWFWLNHFSVHLGKGNLRALVGDYEDQAIRPHALGKFRDLLQATAHHPAMLRYLDNEQNAVNRINENYAREVMELHTLGIDGGYSQRDVQELARILTGVGVNFGPDAPKLKPALQARYVRQGLFEFNPARHDYGDKMFLGKPVRGRGLAELDEALDRLARSPATARFISHKLALFLVGDHPDPALVEQMAHTFLQRDGDIAAVLETLLASPQFQQSLGTAFRDPMHYTLASMRLAYDTKPILNAAPVINWLNRLGEPLYGRLTPDGYPLGAAAWASPAQMTARFDVAKAIGSGSAGLFKTDGPDPQERAAFPQLANAVYYQYLQQTLSLPTRQALDQAGSPQEWNTFLLASPEMTRR